MKITKRQLRRVIREAVHRWTPHPNLMPDEEARDYDRGYSDGWNGVEPAYGASPAYDKGYSHGEAAADKEDERTWREAPEARTEWRRALR